MKGWVSGLVVGVVLGSALAGAAHGQWLSATEILGYDQALRLGYIEGVSDMLSAIISESDEAVVSDGTHISVLRTSLACIEVHTQRTAGEFRRWADGVWQSSVDRGSGDQNAASLLVVDACK